jgi:hypothetical protein
LKLERLTISTVPYFGEVVGGDRRLDLARAHPKAPVGVGVDDRRADLAAERLAIDGHAGLGRDLVDAAGADVDLGIDRGAVDALLDPVQQAHHGAPVVGDRRLEGGLDPAAGQAPEGAGDEASAAAAGQRVVDRRVEVGRDLRLAGGEPPAPVAVVDHDRLPEAGLELAAQLGAPPTSTPPTRTPSAIRSSRARS